MTRAEASAEVRAILRTPMFYLRSARSGPGRFQVWRDEYLGTMTIPNILAKGESWEHVLDRLRANLADKSLGGIWRNLRSIVADAERREAER